MTYQRLTCQNKALRANPLFLLFSVCSNPIYFRSRNHLLLGFLACFIDFLQLTIPLYLKKAVDALKNGTASPDSLLRTGGLSFSHSGLYSGFSFQLAISVLSFSRRMEAELRARLFAHVLVMDRSFFDRHSPGDIITHATNDLSAVQMAGGMGLVAAVDAVIIFQEPH